MHTVIYIPGLGDNSVSGQRLAVRTWRLWGVTPHLFQMSWADSQPFAPKLERLLALIDKQAGKGKVSIVAASAGATAAINAYAARPTAIHGVVCIAGKINNPHAISGAYRSKNPSFAESAALTTGSLQSLDTPMRARVLSIRAMVDLIVPESDSKLTGAQNRVTWTSGHALTIAWQIIFGAPFFIRWLKQLDKKA